MVSHLIRKYQCERKIAGNLILAITEDIFNKLIYNENILNVLITANYSKSGISKSHYYHILKFLRENLILREDYINFRMILPFSISQGTFTIHRAFIYCNDNELYIADYRNVHYRCDACPYKSECEKLLGLIKKEFNIKCRYRNNRELLNDISQQLNEKIINSFKEIIINEIK